MRRSGKLLFVFASFALTACLAFSSCEISPSGVIAARMAYDFLDADFAVHEVRLTVREPASAGDHAQSDQDDQDDPAASDGIRDSVDRVYVFRNGETSPGEFFDFQIKTKQTVQLLSAEFINLQTGQRVYAGFGSGVELATDPGGSALAVPTDAANSIIVNRKPIAGYAQFDKLASANTFSLAFTPVSIPFEIQTATVTFEVAGKRTSIEASRRESGYYAMMPESMAGSAKEVLLVDITFAGNSNTKLCFEYNHALSLGEWAFAAEGTSAFRVTADTGDPASSAALAALAGGVPAVIRVSVEARLDASSGLEALEVLDVKNVKLETLERVRYANGGYVKLEEGKGTAIFEANETAGEKTIVVFFSGAYAIPESQGGNATQTQTQAQSNGQGQESNRGIRVSYVLSGEATVSNSVGLDLSAGSVAFYEIRLGNDGISLFAGMDGN